MKEYELKAQSWLDGDFDQSTKMQILKLRAEDPSGFEDAFYKNLEFVLRATGWYDKERISMRIDEALDKVGLRNKRKNMPYNLSGGERQGVAIARALLNNPDVIIADEPTGNLDPETALDVLKMLLRISDSGTAVLMATHNYGLIQKYPGRIIKCEDHKVICSVVE